MSEHVYDGFGSVTNRKRFVCRSEITKALLLEIGVPAYVTVQEAKAAFDYAVRMNSYIKAWTGSSKNFKQRRRTKFVTKKILLMSIAKCQKG